MSSINLYKDGISEGHKFFVGAGVNIGVPFKEKWQWLLSLSGWRLGEALDDDPEMPLQSFRVGGECLYKINQGNFLFYPFAGFGINYIERKITKNNDEWSSRLSFADFQAGVSAKYKWLFFKVAAKIPVVLDTNGRNIDPNIGGIIGGGLEIKRFFAGYFYEITSFDNNEKGRTAIIASYGMIGYRF